MVPSPPIAGPGVGDLGQEDWLEYMDLGLADLQVSCLLSLEIS